MVLSQSTTHNHQNMFYGGRQYPHSSFTYMPFSSRSSQQMAGLTTSDAGQPTDSSSVDGPRGIDSVPFEQLHAHDLSKRGTPLPADLCLIRMCAISSNREKDERFALLTTRDEGSIFCGMKLAITDQNGCKCFVNLQEVQNDEWRLFDDTDRGSDKKDMEGTASNALREFHANAMRFVFPKMVSSSGKGTICHSTAALLVQIKSDAARSQINGNKLQYNSTI